MIRLYYGADLTTASGSCDSRNHESGERGQCPPGASRGGHGGLRLRQGRVFADAQRSQHRASVGRLADLTGESVQT